MVPWFRDEISRPEIQIINHLFTHSIIHSCIIYTQVASSIAGTKVQKNQT